MDTLTPQSLQTQFRSYYETSAQTSWEFSQMFGEEEDPDTPSFSDGNDEGMITSIAYDVSGTHLAVGYDSGQVVILKQQDEQTYQLHSEFKSHDVAFDFLTSVEIEEKIVEMKWFPFKQTQHPRLLTTNEKTMKLFKVHEKKTKGEPEVQVRSERVFESGHVYNINGIAFNPDGETFISSDDLRINLWNIHDNDEAFVLVDLKPDNMDELDEVITCVDFHPISCNLAVYASTRGFNRLIDLRDTASCEAPKEFRDNNVLGGFLGETVSSISDVKFSPCGRYFASRDYLSMKVWDLRNESQPLSTLRFHDHLLAHLADLYARDALFDKFDLAWNSSGSQLATGSYSNTFFVCDAFGDKKQMLHATKPGQRVTDRLNSNLKIAHLAWHPQSDLIALGAKDYGFLFHKRPLS